MMGRRNRVVIVGLALLLAGSPAAVAAVGLSGIVCAPSYKVEPPYFHPTFGYHPTGWRIWPGPHPGAHPPLMAAPVPPPVMDLPTPAPGQAPEKPMPGAEPGKIDGAVRPSAPRLVPTSSKPAEKRTPSPYRPLPAVEKFEPPRPSVRFDDAPKVNWQQVAPPPAPKLPDAMYQPAPSVLYGPARAK